MQTEPRLRTVDRAHPPYKINKFPSGLIDTFGREIVYMLATKNPMSIEGDEWEKVFAKCVGAEWKPSNVGLDDVQLGSCCWSAKTVKGGRNLANKDKVRLISGRCSPVYSFGAGDVSSDADPNVIGPLVLSIWNERVSAIRENFKTARTVVLVKGDDYTEYLLFETNTIRYEPDGYYFTWNNKGNLEGWSKSEHFHRFTWQPHGAQFTIIEDIPAERLHIRVRKPKPIPQGTVLHYISYDSSWVSTVND